MRLLALSAETAAQASTSHPEDDPEQHVAKSVRDAPREDPVITTAVVDLEQIKAEFHATLRAHRQAKERLEMAHDLAGEPPATPSGNSNL